MKITKLPRTEKMCAYLRNRYFRKQVSELYVSRFIKIIMRKKCTVLLVNYNLYITIQEPFIRLLRLETTTLIKQVNSRNTKNTKVFVRRRDAPPFF